jgi:HTH-type transcriptional regulator, global nitrogen regulator NrpRI
LPPVSSYRNVYMFETPTDVERKILSILKVLESLQKPAGSRVIAEHLKEHGIELTERAVRYHLHIMDERGLTQMERERDGRVITERGIKEIKNALVKDKVGFAISRIEILAFRTNFDYEKRQGEVPVNISFFCEDQFQKALKTMAPALENGYCVSDLVAVAGPGEHIGDVVIPPEKMGIATVCSVVINGTLLKYGIPMDSRFGGILQLQNKRPTRFTEIIHYDGSSVDPSEIFIKAGMTRVKDTVETGNGEILANFREIPAVCRTIAEQVVEGLKRARIKGVLLMGNTSEPVCEVGVDLNRIGIILLGGLNPVALAQEAGINAKNYSMSAVVDYNSLINYKEVLR